MMKPMLAGTVKDLGTIRYPCLVSPKLDGIRCISNEGQAWSRTGKLIPNRFVQACFKELPTGLDGELMLVGGDFNGVQSAVMSRDGLPTFHYHIFDLINSGRFGDRLSMLSKIGLPIWASMVKQSLVINQGQLMAREEAFVTAGYEGMMIRSVEGRYKHGRSTVREGGLLKLKRFSDAEAQIVGFEELVRKDGTPAGILGALECVTVDGVKFSIGTGFSLAQREQFWAGRYNLFGLVVTYKYQPGSGSAPRFPVFLRWREAK